jgi:hypothetical protein
MASTSISAPTEERITLLFPPEKRALVRTLLSGPCGNDLPFMEQAGEAALERLHFAALKLSEGNLDKLYRAVELANRDGRDLLMAAGFGEDIKAHTSWLPQRTWKARV